MLNVVLTIAYVVLPLLTMWLLRSVASGTLVVAVSLGVSGTIVQFLGLSWASITLPVLQVWLLVTLLAPAIYAAWRRRRPLIASTRQATLIILAPVVAIAVVLLITRTAAPGAPGPLTSVGYLITRSSAEDNAKWLNAASHLAQGLPIDSWANVGGPLLLLMTAAATMLSAVSGLLYQGINEVAVSSGTPILAESLLIVLSPLALSPLAEATWRLRDGRSLRGVPAAALLLGVAVIVSATAVLLNYGHLTLQYVLVVLTLWVATFLSNRQQLSSRVLAVVIVVTTAEVWFPLNLLALGLLIALLGWGVAGVLRGRERTVRVASSVTAVVLLVLMWDFLSSSITYSLGIGASAAAAGGGAARGLTAAVVPTLPLFSAGGGTEIVSPLLAGIALLSLIGALLVTRNAGASSRQQVLTFSPMIVLAGYSVAVSMADFWAVGSGPNYSSSKLFFAITIPVLAATLPLAPLALDPDQRHMTVLRGFAIAGILVLLVLDTLLPRALAQLKPNLWPTTATDPQPYWWPAEVRPTGGQPLAANPVGCVYLPQGATLPSALPNGQLAYSCTRLLTGIAGEEAELGSLVEWQLTEWLQNRSLWDSYSVYFQGLSQEARNRRLILLDGDGNVVGIDSLQSLMNRFPAKPGTQDS